MPDQWRKRNTLNIKIKYSEEKKKATYAALNVFTTE
jgi:hypothetical protein